MLSSKMMEAAIKDKRHWRVIEEFNHRIAMKQFKLVAHQKDFSEEDLIINPRDFPDLKLKDVVEIYHSDEKFSRLLLQVNCLKEDFQLKDTVSVEQGIAISFQLRTYADVCISIVDSQTVALDSLELTFKDQYVERGDMWRLKRDLEDTCVYLNKKVEFCGIRCQVYEMWAQGERVACGVVNDDTKIVFRSSTNLVYLFIQMSSEMWDVDINGDLYFEKAINGFFSDLFAKWKENSSSHEVTIVLFSRTFYEAQAIEDFPPYMRHCIQADYRGRFYEDFYSVAVQNERYDDWAVILVYLKKLFNNYQALILQIHQRPNIKDIPKAVNSTAAQGNFLEVLNMSLNVFEKHYLDRSFDRTGHLSVVITPGVGVFEVDRELTNLTKQRIIDNGVGSDLVCLGEQPLHAVPLFKFHNKNTLSTVDDYSMPHWINLSFYSSSKQATYSSFIPRIKLPPRKVKLQKEKLKSSDVIQQRNKTQHKEDFPTLVDYDEYDAQVFRHTVPGNANMNSRRTGSLQRGAAHRKKSDNASVQGMQIPSSRPVATPQRSGREFDGGAPLLETSRSLTTARSAAITIPQKSSYYCEYSTIRSSIDNTSPTSLFGSYDEEQSPPPRPIVGSAGSPFSCYHQKPGPATSLSSSVRPGRALINPFDPSHVTIKLTSNRRRWTHVFPLGPTGIFMQQHHYQAIPHRTSNLDEKEEDCKPSHEVLHAAHLVVDARKHKTVFSSESQTGILIQQHHYQKIPHKTRNLNEKYYEPDEPSHEILHAAHLTADSRKQKTSMISTQNTSDISSRFKGTPSRGSLINTELKSEKSLTLLWGATGEQEWTPALTTGVDWKSLTIPACLPLTTDYFPDRRSLQNDYVVSDYDLIPELMSSDLAQKKTINHRQLTIEEVFTELVCQRLQQGFQLIVNPRATKYGASRSLLPKQSIISSPQFPSQPLMLPGRSTSESMEENKEEYFLSIGRIFHQLTLAGPTIKATCLKPRHPYPTLKISYKYRFKAPYSDSYEVSSVDFYGEKLENFNWNYLDHYICCHSEGDFGLTEFLKYMRVRFFLLPVLSQGTKKILDCTQLDATISPRCDVYDPLSPEDEAQLVDNFLKFVEVLNKFRIPGTVRKHKERCVTLAATRRSHYQLPPSTNMPFVYSQQLAISSPLFRDRLDSNRPFERPRARTASKVMERVRSESGNGGVSLGRDGQHGSSGDIGDIKPISSSSLSLDTGTDNLANTQKDSSEESSPSTTPRRLTLGSSTMEEIVEAMKQANDGLNFLTNMANLPALTFISAEAVGWVMEHVEGAITIAKAIDLLERMREKDFLCHASGNPSFPFIYGFFLYHICPTDRELMLDIYSYHSLGNIDRFQQEWFEVAIHFNFKWPSHSGLPKFFEKSVDFHKSFFKPPQTDNEDLSKNPTRIPLFKNTNIDISSSTKSIREEWGHVRYHGNYAPGAAFELVLKWMVATGSIVTELVHQNWARRATSYGFLLVPVPSDLFAVPFSPQSDPLRGSIFIPLNVNCLCDDGQDPFKDLSKEMKEFRIFLLQETIGRRFGFLPCQHDNLNSTTHDSNNESQWLNTQGQSSGADRHYPQYVHTTGNMFLIIMTNQRLHHEKISSSTFHSNPARKKSFQENVQQFPQGHFSAMLPTSSRKTDSIMDTHEPKLGFYWSWNYMVSKRWRSGSTGDDQFMFTVLKDFRAFCSNTDNRLRKFCDDCINDVQVK